MGRAAREALDVGNAVANGARRVEVIALFPILVLSAYAMGGPKLVLAAAMVLPSLLALQALGRKPDDASFSWHHARKCHLHSGSRHPARHAGTHRRMHGMESACFLLEIDDWDTVESRIGTETARDLRDECQRGCAQRCAATIWWQNLARHSSASCCIRSPPRAWASGMPSRTACARNSAHQSWWVKLPSG
jgi:hypothetical protein